MGWNRRRSSRISRSLKSQLALQINGANGNFQGSLEPLEWCQMAPTSMEELSVRYMELLRTSLDIIHTYGTHVNMSIFFSDQLKRCLKPRSARRPRSSHDTGHATESHAYALADLAEHATPNVPTRQIRSRNRTNDTAQDRFQCSVTAIAQRGPESRRCHAQTRALMMLSTTAGSTAMMVITPAP